jgi:hypothetical protein
LLKKEEIMNIEMFIMVATGALAYGTPPMAVFLHVNKKAIIGTFVLWAITLAVFVTYFVGVFDNLVASNSIVISLVIGIIDYVLCLALWEAIDKL